MRDKIVKFLIVGGTNTLLMYLLYLGLIYLGMHYGLALALDYVCGVLLGYILNRHWTFASHGKQINSFPRYVLTYVGVFAGNMALLVLFVESGLLGPELGQLIAFGLVTVMSFILQNAWVFKKPQKEDAN